MSPPEFILPFCDNEQRFTLGSVEVSDKLHDSILKLAQRFTSGRYAKEHKETGECEGTIMYLPYSMNQIPMLKSV
jgi:hypothetical protein